MTATDELRRLLDERGVEWRKAPHYSGESQDNETIFEGNGIEWYTNDHMNGRLGLRALRYEVTPEQAIEATLGSDLKAENEKLREERDMYRDLVGMMDHPDLNVQLQAENDKLQEQIQDAEHEESIAWDRVRSAERRNDELRKLLVDFRNAMWSGGEWTEPFDERMRELGVEV